MRFMTIYKPREETTTPPTQEHIAAMGRFIEELAKAFAKIGNDHAHFFRIKPKRAGQLPTAAKGILRAGPHCEFIVGPFGNRRPGLQRTVLNIGDVIRFVQNLLGLRKFVLEWIVRDPALGMILKELEQGFG